MNEEESFGLVNQPLTRVRFVTRCRICLAVIEGGSAVSHDRWHRWNKDALQILQDRIEKLEQQR